MAEFTVTTTSDGNYNLNLIDSVLTVTTQNTDNLIPSTIVAQPNAVVHDITVDQGSTYSEEFIIETLTDPQLPFDAITNPYLLTDLSLATITLSIKASYDSLFDTITATNTNGMIGVTELGHCVLTLVPDVTNKLVFAGKAASYVYDLRIQFSPSNVLKPVQGRFIVNKGV